MTLKNRGLGVVLGFGAFLSGHAVEAARWAQWFGAAHGPWFLNSGRAIAFMVGWMFALSACGGAARLSAFAIYGGAMAAMTAVLMWTGPGSIWPIAWAAGSLFVAFACLLGAWIGKELAGRARPPADS